MITNKMKVVQLKMREARFSPKMKSVPIFLQVLWQFLETACHQTAAGRCWHKAPQFPNWRRGWDSNPRSLESENGFQDRHHQPLGHPSTAQKYK